MPAVVDLTAARLPIYCEPNDAISVPITVPAGYESGTWVGYVYRNARLLGTPLATFAVNVAGQVVTISLTAAQVSALTDTGTFHGYWMLARTPPASSARQTWFDGDLLVDAERASSHTGSQAVTAALTNTTVAVAPPATVTSVAPLVKVTYLTAAVSGVAADGWYYHGGIAANFTARWWSVAWEGTASQIPAQGTADGALQRGDIAITRSTTL